MGEKTFGRAVRGQKNHRGGWRHFTNTLHYLEPVAIRHAHVGNHQRTGHAPEFRQGFPGAARCRHFPAVTAEAPDDDGPFDEMADWKKVYEEYLIVRRRCGEPTDTLTFDKFKSTLERNKAALVERHNCTRVKFTVYEKDGKAALKASPMK